MGCRRPRWETHGTCQMRKARNDSVGVDALSCLLIHRGAAYSPVYPADRLKCSPTTRMPTIGMQMSATVGESSAPWSMPQTDRQTVCVCEYVSVCLCAAILGIGLTADRMTRNACSQYDGTRRRGNQSAACYSV
ncbi:hypothetical protein COCMIDRAFT_37245 [Bipolaris oryzae ATCC 44560]|uniref:Uncharacterized protein n=1 Tax=Bipolaris oryzae ATCC 44560 TaxID=930090 RepID=W6Z5G6_COCMI|nr:uncharacterized protein COCMIDRAFT_37245 [Bipolaris oryzae ATCC 44560]EUC45013.1 hypothetical protein COCMIDRAFT_37245 [Bipolaris oryzae ATCC 44560]